MLTQQDIMENSDPSPTTFQGSRKATFQIPDSAHASHPPPPAPPRRRTEALQPADKVFAVGFSFGWLCVHSVYKLSCTEAQERARDEGWWGDGSRGVREREEERRD